MAKLVYAQHLKCCAARLVGSIPTWTTDIMSFESEQAQRRRTLEGREASAENKENQEDDAELKKAASLERADIIVKEVRQNQKQMQNIIMHMQTVLIAIRQLRQQLQLVEGDDDPASIKQDKSRIAEIKKKIKDYGDELQKMRGDLIREQVEELKNGADVGLSLAELEKRAEEMVERMIEEVKKY